jgi:hypothetical protein
VPPEPASIPQSDVIIDTIAFDDHENARNAKGVYDECSEHDCGSRPTHRR